MPALEVPVQPKISEIERAAIVLTLFTEFFGSEQTAIEFMRQHPGTRFDVPLARVTEKMLSERRRISGMKSSR